MHLGAEGVRLAQCWQPLLLFPLVLISVLAAAHQMSLDVSGPKTTQKPTTTTLSYEDSLVYQEEMQALTKKFGANLPKDPVKPRKISTYMSCWACSTMDYEDASENPCRLMAKYRNPKLPVRSYKNSTLLEYITTKLLGKQAGSSPALDQQQQQQQNQSTSSTSSVNNRTSLPTDQVSTTKSTQKSSHNGGLGEEDLVLYDEASLHPYIKTKPCFEDENYCTTLYITKLDVVSDYVHQTFWAMERNCSRSCNAGCMVIGDRFRLRICSTCCKGPNCNGENPFMVNPANSDANHSMRLANVLLSISSTVLVAALIRSGLF